MGRDDSDYFAQRERCERAAAKQAASPQARRVHQELAQNYAERLRGHSNGGEVASDGRSETAQSRSRLTIIAPTSH